MADLEKLMVAELKRNLVARDRPRLPAGGELLWRWFNDLSATRAYHMGGPNPIGYAEIFAYADIYRWPLEPRHVAILIAMDRVYIEASYAKRHQAPNGVKTLSPRSEHAMTVGMFDALFG